MAIPLPESSPLSGELRRAASEIRFTLGVLAKREKLPACLMHLCTLLDRVTLEVTSEPGESAFVLDETGRRILFREEVLARIRVSAAVFASGLPDLANDELERVAQLAINEVVLHELIHVQQNFPTFATVNQIKTGLPGWGLPMLDNAADTVAAWVCARIEAERLGLSETEFLRFYVNCLLLAYLVGTSVFAVRGRPEKMQRALGLLMSAVLVQAQIDGRLIAENVYHGWDPITPVMAFDLQAAEAFNAIVVDRMPGLLISEGAQDTSAAAMKVWCAVGVEPLPVVFNLVAKAFILAGVVRGNV